MKSPIVFVVFAALFVLIAILPPRSEQVSSATTQTAFQKTEAAYRANNIGVALLEQYRAREAVESFQRALEMRSDLLIARINLAIALYYLPDAEGAKREAEKGLAQKPDAPQPHYILGLIARAQNRLDDAVAEFQKVLRVDPGDVGANVNIGQIFVQQKKQSEAIEAFRRAIAAEPSNETALYNLGLLLTRTGKREEGQRLLQKFQQLKQSGAGTSIGNNYLEGGRFAEAISSTGLEAELVDQNTPVVAFRDVTAEAFVPSASRRLRALRGAVKQNLLASLGGGMTLFDYDSDGDQDLYAYSAEQKSWRLYRNDKRRFVDVTAQSGGLAQATGLSAVAGDFDNDGLADLFVFGAGSCSLYRNEGGGRFANVSVAAKIPGYPYLSRSGAFLDYDHDGDLDIFVAGLALGLKKVRNDASGTQKSASTLTVFPHDFSPAPNLLLRNNGDGTFADVTAPSRIAGAGRAAAVVPTDYDNRRDADLLVVNYDAPPALHRNLRDGTFNDVSREVGFFTGESLAATAVAAGDVNKDGFTDFFFGRGWCGTFTVKCPFGIFAISDGRAHFRIESGPDATWGEVNQFSKIEAAQFLDYDNDGLLDLLALVSTNGVRVALRVWRNTGRGWNDVSGAAARSVETQINTPRGVPFRYVTLISADVDDDGDTDVLFNAPGGGPKLARNDGGNRNYSTKIGLHGRVSNRSAVQSKVEMRAGSLYQKLETYSVSPAPAPADLMFGLGMRERPDAIRVLWPAGIVQAETEFPASVAGRIKLDITELDRKPSSCPYLYAWNGERFEFVTDFLGGGEMGYLEAPGHYNKPDPDEYVRITSDQLKEKDGRYELRVTNELEEALFVDRLQLLAVAHPVGTEVYPNEGMTATPKPFKLFVTKDARPPLSAKDDHGHDVLDLISRIDRRWPDDFKVDRIRGYAEEHALTIELPDAGSADVSSASARRSLAKNKEDQFPERQSLSARQGGKAASSRPTDRVLLLLTGWTDYAWSSDNVAATQAGKAMKPPSLQVKDKNGAWRTVIEDIGIPVGRPQTVTVDLTGKFLSDKREVRIVTNMRIYWDQILVSESNETPPGKIVKLDPVSADLRWRGYSAEVTPDGREPFGYDYRRVSFISPWKVMTGRYTREGDVRELLLQTDDMFAICRTGDEISLSFDAKQLPQLPAGWTRTFLLYSDGFSKEMDINSASPDQVGPLPFHGMSRYPYQWPERYPLTEARRNYLEKYNTRVVTAPVASIESLLFNR